MKRKDTKCYQDLVEKYCSNRLNFETAEDLISDTKETIETSQKKYAEIDNGDNAIKTWFDCFVSILNAKIEMSIMNKVYYKEKMEKFGKLLVSDYGEDLEKLYDDYEVN